MANPDAPAEWEETQKAARFLGLTVELLDVRNQDDLGSALELAVRHHVDALFIGADGLAQMHVQMIVDSVARNRLPATYPFREFVEAGGLLAYAVNYPDLYSRFAGFVDRISKERSLASFPWSSQPNSCFRSISRRQRRSASRSHRPYCCAPMGRFGHGEFPYVRSFSVPSLNRGVKWWLWRRPTGGSGSGTPIEAEAPAGGPMAHSRRSRLDGRSPQLSCHSVEWIELWQAATFGSSFTSPEPVVQGAGYERQALPADSPTAWPLAAVASLRRATGLLSAPCSCWILNSRRPSVEQW